MSFNSLYEDRMTSSFILTRRSFIASTIAASIAGSAARAGTVRPQSFNLRAASSMATLLGDNKPKTPVWSYNGEVPAPILRLRQGAQFRALFKNDLSQATSIHWHGIRKIRPEMDGVPGFAAGSIAPGASFDYTFEVPDAGTFWYHPHLNGREQLGRGLFGALIVEEANPPIVDREEVWVFSDWRLDLKTGQHKEDFADKHDAAHAGRVGETITLNHTVPKVWNVRAGERVRVRLINAATARIFKLGFTGHSPWIIALDGQPISPYQPEKGAIVLAPGERVDIILDMTGDPGSRHAVQDSYYPQDNRHIMDLVYSADKPLRDRPLSSSVALPNNSLPELNLSRAVKFKIAFDGGAMGRLPAVDAVAHEEGKAAGFWAINGVIVMNHDVPPLLEIKQGATVLLDMVNLTRWDHPIHLHGHHFRVLARNGKPDPLMPWKDTILLRPDERAEVAFVAETRGDWMVHCHILAHQETGMMGTIRIT